MSKRVNRGLMNFLGSGIKFITGNLTDTDLEIITQNFETIKHNQLNAIHKINDLSLFAGNIMNEFQKTLRDINENSETITKKLFTINNELNIILSIVFSFTNMETFEIEIITSKEIDEIWHYLKQHYPKNALWSIGHMTELTLICKAGLLILDNMVILAIKIPIFEQSVCNLKFVYPIPNNESKIVISPNPLIDSCSLLQDCQYAAVQNSYYVHTLTYKNALLICTRTEEVIYENCFKFDKIRLGGCHIIQREEAVELFFGLPSDPDDSDKDPDDGTDQEFSTEESGNTDLFEPQSSEEILEHIVG
ncbi:hypothetical protein ABEB36_015666 [Hypothenemus hampei]|uniref:Uncharacterized protein n=1 Tax=Hypothenemus hampei TaxID=57062 RepID=A0ABD1DZ71_HYPHA